MQSKIIYSLSGIPGVGKTTRGRELEQRFGWKFYAEPTEEWPLTEFYAVKADFEAGRASKEDMMDATNYLQLRVGISYLKLGIAINAFMACNPDVPVVVERSPFDTTLFLRANTIPDDLRAMQIKQYDALKDFMSMYNNIEPWCNVHHIFLRCDIDETVSRLLSRDETRISRPYLHRLHEVHSAAFPEVEDLKTSTFVGEKCAYDIIDVTQIGVSETCALICNIHRFSKRLPSDCSLDEAVIALEQEANVLELQYSRSGEVETRESCSGLIATRKNERTISDLVERKFLPKKLSSSSLASMSRCADCEF